MDLRVATCTEEKCLELLVQIRWQGKPKCLECDHDETYFLKTTKRFKCKRCSYQFSVTKGTFMENTKLSLPKWFALIEEFCEEKNARKISRKLRINYRTAWLACKKLTAVVSFLNQAKLDGIVEFDETISGSARDQSLARAKRISNHNKKEKEKEQIAKENGKVYEPRAYGHQRAMLNIISRNGGQIVKRLGASKRDITTDKIKDILVEHVCKNATVYMDSHPTHVGFEKLFKKIKKVTHTLRIPLLDEEGNPLFTKNGNQRYKYQKCYKDKDGIHTNGVEASNARLKLFLRKFVKHSFKYSQLFYDEYVFHRFCNKMEVLEKIRQVLWNSQSAYITLRELMAMDNEYPEKRWKKPKKRVGKSHSRKKKEKPVNFVFS